jgi:hypothetical protein
VAGQHPRTRWSECRSTTTLPVSGHTILSHKQHSNKRTTSLSRARGGREKDALDDAILDDADLERPVRHGPLLQDAAPALFGFYHPEGWFRLANETGSFGPERGREVEAVPDVPEGVAGAVRRDLPLPG